MFNSPRTQKAVTKRDDLLVRLKSRLQMRQRFVLRPDSCQGMRVKFVKSLVWCSFKILTWRLSSKNMLWEFRNWLGWILSFLSSGHKLTCKSVFDYFWPCFAHFLWLCSFYKLYLTLYNVSRGGQVPLEVCLAMISLFPSVSTKILYCSYVNYLSKWAQNSSGHYSNWKNDFGVKKYGVVTCTRTSGHFWFLKIWAQKFVGCT